MKHLFFPLCIALAGCNQQQQPARAADAASEQPDRPEPAPAKTAGQATAATIHRGMLRLNAPLTFKPCGAQAAVPVRDANGKVAQVPRDLAPDTSGVLFAIVRGVRADSMRVDEVLYAMGEGYECYTDWTGFEARALGNEPGWVIEVNAGTLKLQRQGGFKAEWARVGRENSANLVRYTADDVGHGKITVTLERKVCRDGMSGAFYIWAATLKLGEETLSGCGLVTS